MKAYAVQLKRSTAERDRLISEHLEIARRISLRMARRVPRLDRARRSRSPPACSA